MQSTRIKISSIVESQLPGFVRTEYPLVEQLLKEYYSSLDSVGLPYDVLSNIDKYVKVDHVADTIESTTLTESIFSTTETIVANTKGFPKTYGLIKIDDEIILYKSKTDSSFTDCVRGFSGVTKYASSDIEDLEFSSSLSTSHNSGANVENLSGLILKQFFDKIKKQFLPGFEGRELYEGVKESTFLKQSKDFYNSKGTSDSFEILFRCLYGEDVNVILPKHNLISLSDSVYEITRNFVVTPVQGNPDELINQTIFQDQYENTLRKSFGTVSNVEKIIRGEDVFYNLKVDSTINNPYQNLKIHSTTSTISESPAASDKITVDSTLSFENSGEIIVSFDNKNYIITYTDKTINQFLNCTGIDEEIPTGADVSINSFAYGFSPTGEEIRFRFNGVISDTNLTEGSKYYRKDDVGRLLSLGYDARTPLENNWIINNSVRCNVKSFTPTGPRNISVETFDRNYLQKDDLVEIQYTYLSAGVNLSQNDIVSVESINSASPQKGFTVNSLSQLANSIVQVNYVKRVINKVRSNDFMSDVLNVYKDFNNDDVYVTSSSLPSYFENNDTKDFKFDFVTNPSRGNIVSAGSTTVLNLVYDIFNHGLITGDSIVYKSTNSTPQLGISTGIYFVNKVNNQSINIARSRSDLFTKKYVTLGITTSNITNEYIQLKKFDKDITTIDSQRIIRKISTPQNSNKKFKTLPGTTGILLNGVEVLNYKSDDFIYYGGLERIDVTSTTSGLDIISPPVLGISSAASGLNNAKGTCGVEGGLTRIDIVDPGFDYTDTPVITITGGSGSGAKATVQLIDYDYSVSFNASSTNTSISLTLDQIGFSTFHKFRSGEYVVYNTFGSTSLGGLVDNSKYYVGVVDDFKITLHRSEDDSLTNSNRINLISFGLGSHSFRSIEKKKRVSSISVVNSGSGYKNKEIKVPSTGINIANDTINTFQHPYESGEVIFYYGGDTNISGLDTGKYIVTRLDDTSFKLSEVGVGDTRFNYFYDTKQYVNLTSQGSGLHEFNYEKISVSIDGPLGTASTLPGNQAQLQPVFRGNLTSISLSDGGVGYGSSEIINFNKQPDVTLTSGSGAAATPIISNGRIVDVIVYQKGKQYNSPPDIRITGSGIGAILTPIIENGVLQEIKVINSGINYGKNDTLVEIVNPIGKLKTTTYPKTKNINLYQRLSEGNQFSNEDNNVVYRGRNSKFGLQFTHLYAPKKLRDRLFTANLENNLFRVDTENDNNNLTVFYHSPILGWSYDGNPIYGPYGFESITNKTVKRIRSSYKINETSEYLSDRPSQSKYELGYFVEDWIYDPTVGDLDENNGRFCVTPEFPQGVYAYFTTIDDQFDPFFPYIIGESYHSDVIDFNLNVSSTQDRFDFTDNIVRNTNLYNSLSFKSNYEYFLNISKVNLQNSIANSVNSGGVDSLLIISPGDNYKVGETISFESEEQPSVKALGQISRLSGRTITDIENETTVIENVELYPNFDRTQFIAFSTSPHGLQEGNQITIDSLNRESLEFQSTFKVNLRQSNELILSVGVGDEIATGIATYFNVVGDLKYPNIRENDILTIGSEKVKVLNVDELSSRIRVLRSQESTTSSQHSSYTKLTENPRKLFVTLPKEISNEKYALNKEIYFDPSESVGIGTSSSTLVFSNPGFGVTSAIIPERSIFLKNHNLNSGDLITYKSNTGNPVSVSTDGFTPFSLSDIQNLYVTKLTDDLIGISSSRLALSDDGSYVGIGTTSGLLYFNGIGTKKYHSFTTNYKNALIGDLNLYKTTVSTATTHGLTVGDSIIMDAKPTTNKTFIVKYSDSNKRLIIDPKDFVDGDVDVEGNLITIQDHGYSDGDKVIFNSTDPDGGLNDDQMYYISAFNKNKIKLYNSYYDSVNKINEVGITSDFPGTFSEINPRISATRDNIVVFDLSDSSLSETQNNVTISAFDFRLYIDKNLTDELISISSGNNNLEILGVSNIKYTGEIGITSNAKVEFSVNSLLEDKIYYDLVPIGNAVVKSQIIQDDEVKNNNEIIFVDSVLSGKKQIVGTGASSFEFYNEKEDLISSYTQSQGNFTYTTDSKSALGPINDTRLISKGNEYKSLPYVSKINTSSGTNALLVPESDEIGSIVSTKIKDIGFNYSSDPTLKPLVKFSTKYRVEPLSNVESIRVITPGLNYITNPDIILLDAFTKEPVEDLFLEYQIGNEFVDIVQNTKGIYNIDPTVVVYNNSNGVGISSILYDPGARTVRLTLNSSFNTLQEFPFEVNDYVFVEGININETIGEDAKGYNSEDYGYNNFRVTEIFPNLGASGAFIKYTLSDYLSVSDNPGTWDLSQTGSVVNVKSLPTFDITLAKNKFELDEPISNGETEGVVRGWEPNNEYLTVELDRDYTIGDLVVGSSSKSQAFIKEITKYETFYQVDSSSVVNEGWKDEVGFLNTQEQRIQDSDYYQNFSYVLESRVQLETWGNDVNNLNHTLGFKKFATYIFDADIDNVGLETDQNNGSFDSTVDVLGLIDIECITNFDLVSENFFYVNGTLNSDEIIFNSVVLLDYAESIGNRALIIDDISDEFTSQISQTFVTSFNI